MGVININPPLSPGVYFGNTRDNSVASNSTGLYEYVDSKFNLFKEEIVSLINTSVSSTISTNIGDIIKGELTKSVDSLKSEVMSDIDDRIHRYFLINLFPILTEIYAKIDQGRALTPSDIMSDKTLDDYLAAIKKVWSTLGGVVSSGGN